MRIYLDLCSIQRPLDDRSQLRIRLEAEAVLAILALCESDQADLLTSDALRFETERNSDLARKSYTDETLSTAGDWISSTGAVEGRARTYISAGLKPLDALHLASAVEGGADYFCTCDDKLLKRARMLDT